MNEHHSHEHEEGHKHTHGAVDPVLATTKRGIWAIKWSFVGLFLTAIFQLYIVFLSGSVALLADTIHNFGDAATAIPLWVAFLFARLKPTKRFSYGYGKLEDVACVMIVFIILISAIVAGYSAVLRLLHPQEISHLGAVIMASIIGFLGNEAVAMFRIKVGKEINSAALIADGYHARTDGYTSLAVLLGAIGVWLGFPLADPLVGLLISVTILKIVWESGKEVFTRLLDGADPKLTEEILHEIHHVKGVTGVHETRVRWLGHRIHLETNISVDPKMTVEEGHHIAVLVQEELKEHFPYLSNAVVHVDPSHSEGEGYHLSKCGG